MHKALLSIVCLLSVSIVLSASDFKSLRLSIDAMPENVKSTAETTSQTVTGSYSYASNWSARFGAVFDGCSESNEWAYIMGISARYGVAGGPNTQHATRSTMALLGDGELGFAFNPRDETSLELVGIVGIGFGMARFKTATTDESYAGTAFEYGLCFRPIIEIDYGYRLFAEVGYLSTSLSYNSSGYRITDTASGAFGGAGLCVSF